MPVGEEKEGPVAGRGVEGKPTAGVGKGWERGVRVEVGVGVREGEVGRGAQVSGR